MYKTPGFSTLVANQRSAMPELFQLIPKKDDSSSSKDVGGGVGGVGANGGSEQQLDAAYIAAQVEAARNKTAKKKEARVRRASLLAIPETKDDSNMKYKNVSKSFIIKVVFPPIGIAHRSSKSFNADALKELRRSLISGDKSGDSGGGASAVEGGGSGGSGGLGPYGSRSRMGTMASVMTEGGSKGAPNYKPVDKRGFLKKRGHTTHLMTSNFKARWFELDASNLLLTYYEKEPPTSIMGDGNAERIAEEKKKELAKGAVDCVVFN